MNTESRQEEDTPLSIGQKLRQAREERGLSQKQVADHLCLRLVTIRDIEEDDHPAGLAPAFMRGYIKAYARYVNLPESEIPLSDDMPAKMVVRHETVKRDINKKELKTASVKGFPLNKSSMHKRRDSWLMLITWIILVVVIGLSGVWWWQNHNKEVGDIDRMNVSSTIELDKAKSEGRIIPLNGLTGTNDNVLVLPSRESSQPVQTQANDVPRPGDAISISLLFQQRQTLFPNPNAMLTAEAQALAKIKANTVTMTFNDRSWLSVTHRVNGRTETLFSGQKNRGEQLELSGTPPYRIMLGRPEVVQIEFGGRIVPSQTQFTLNAAD